MNEPKIINFLNNETKTLNYNEYRKAIFTYLEHQKKLSAVLAECSDEEKRVAYKRYATALIAMQSLEAAKTGHEWLMDFSAAVIIEGYMETLKELNQILIVEG